MGYGIAIEKHVKKIRNSIHEIPIYASFSYKSASKPGGRIGPTRFERVNIQRRADL